MGDRVDESLESAPEETPIQAYDPRALLADWANNNDEWVRLLVAEVVATGRAVSTSVVAEAYDAFLQEKALEKRTLPPVEKLSTEPRQDDAAPELSILRLSDVCGVNALVTGSVIEPHQGLTILYGENGTGKTGYARIFKALAASRTVDEILGNMAAATDEAQTAMIQYRLGGDEVTLHWAGEHGVSPFTRMSIFDSPSVSTHVDDDLDYVYVPATLALFNHVISAVQAVAARVDGAINDLNSDGGSLLKRFQNGSSIYPEIETLGAATDLEELKALASTEPDVESKIEVLTQAVAALKANTLATQVFGLKRDRSVLEQASAAAAALSAFDAKNYNETLAARAQLQIDYESFRRELFAAADLPAEPDDTWSTFIEAGDTYRQHLEALQVHDTDRCLYCRQTMDRSARDLLSKYSTYLDDKISAEIRAANSVLADHKLKLAAIKSSEITGFIDGYAEREDKPAFLEAVKTIEATRSSASAAVEQGDVLDVALMAGISSAEALVNATTATVNKQIETLEEQSKNRTDALAQKQRELIELTAAAELGKSWSTVETRVRNAKRADRLRSLKRAFPTLQRGLTELSKAVSDQLVNQSFDALFVEECEALRAPSLKLQFVGRQGRAHRRKVLHGPHKPSKVLSEGEQKVLAMADFLAEARLAGITAPVVFDDPVSSLDHRRINEVAERVANLAETTQVIVFTHDIFFATKLLSLFEQSKRCTYFQVTDEGGKGKVTRATGPRWDTLSGIKAKINTTIEAAKQQEGEAREALVRTGYDWLRSWCEVFTETELLRGVSQRYKPNIGMTQLANIRIDKIGEIIPEITAIFDEACRYIDGHSQPLVTLSVSPTLSGLEEHWKQLQALKKLNDA
ncbi:MAG: AAA family ATPase [Candidatus Nanopelagicales bacterium]